MKRAINFLIMVILPAIHLSAQNYSECQGPAAHMNPACNGDNKIEYPKREKPENQALPEIITAGEVNISGVVVNAKYEFKKPNKVKISAQNTTKHTKSIKGEISLSDHSEDRLAGRCRFFMKVPAMKKYHKNIKCKVEGKAGHMVISAD